MKSFLATVGVTAKQELSSGWWAVMKKYFVRLITFFFLLFLWQSIPTNDISMTQDQLLTYTLLSTALRQFMDIITPATSSLWEGSIVGRYTRPMHVFSSFIAETIGRWWIPSLLCFALPLLLVGRLMGITLLPPTPSLLLWGLSSLLLASALGFAMDFIFASLAMHLKNACWVATIIRESILSLVSGAVIPFALMPVSVSKVLEALPFGALASTPLTVYLGLTPPLKALGSQLAWTVLFWVAAVKIYTKSEEKVVSFGG